MFRIYTVIRTDHNVRTYKLFDGVNRIFGNIAAIAECIYISRSQIKPVTEFRYYCRNFFSCTLIKRSEDSVVSVYDSAVVTGNAVLDTVLTEKSLRCYGSGVQLICVADGKLLSFMADEDVAKEAFISLLEASNHDARRALDAVNMKPNVRFRTKDDYAVIAMVRQGLGVSIMPSLLLRGNSENIEIRPIDPPVSRTIALAVAGDDPAPAPRKFAELAEKWVRENGKRG